MRNLFPLLLFLAACSDAPPTTPETRPVENPNAGNTAIYDVDPDDPYEIDARSFLDLTPGAPVAASKYLIDEGIMDTGDGEAHLYYIHGDRNDTLGYLLLKPGDELIGDIHIKSPDVVTTNGIRVGVTHGELKERLGKLTYSEAIYGNAILASTDGMSYQLEFYRPDSFGPLPEVPDDTQVTEIIIPR